eukprot:4715756-Pleurochrysis_carterae.AAC.1
MACARTGQLPAVVLLLQHGAAVDSALSSEHAAHDAARADAAQAGFNALFLACRFGHHATARTLIQVPLGLDQLLRCSDLILE